MPNYDFAALSPLDFENLSRDLLQKEFGVRLESFTSGRDLGIDLRYTKDERSTLVVQCKHFTGSSFSTLLSLLRRTEVPKIQRLKPTRYVLTTSLPLTPARKDKLLSLLSPYCRTHGDIFGRTDFNGLLAKYPDVEVCHFKLWLASTAVLKRVLHNGLIRLNEADLRQMMDRAKLYVSTESFPKALHVLEQRHVCVIAGIPGIGKSTLAEALCLSYLREGYELVKVSADIAEGFTFHDPSKKQVFFYDDFLGQFRFGEKMTKNEDKRLVSFMREVAHSQYSRLVMTTREYILAQARTLYQTLDDAPLQSAHMRRRTARLHGHCPIAHPLQPFLLLRYPTACSARRHRGTVAPPGHQACEFQPSRCRMDDDSNRRRGVWFRRGLHQSLRG